MLSSLFEITLCMSLAGGVLSLAVLAVRPLTKKLFGCRWNYYIWLLLMVVMLVPISFEASAPSRNTSVEGEFYHSKYDLEKPQVYTPQPTAERQSLSVASPNDSDIWLKAFSKIWIMVALALLVFKLSQYFLFYITLRKNSKKDTPHKSIGVYQTQMVSAPLSLGLFKKTIFLPETSGTSKEREYILMHEFAHIKHRDLVFKWLFMLVRCIHWFNPMVYIISKIADEECEINCDYSVTKNMNDDEKRQYMNTILNCISGKCLASPLSTRMAGSSEKIVRRFKSITKQNKKNPFVIGFSAGIFVIIILCSAFSSALAVSKLYDGDIKIITINLKSDTVQSSMLFEDTSDKKEALPKPAKPDTYEDSVKPQARDMGGQILQKPSSAWDASNSGQHNPDDNEKNETHKPALSGTHQKPLPPNQAPDTSNAAVTNEQNQSSSENVPSEDLMTEDTSGTNENSKVEEPLTDSPESAFENDDSNYPGDMVGYITLEDWSYNKMRNDLAGLTPLDISSTNVKLGGSYICGELSYESGNIARMVNVSPNSNGRIAVYLDSEYDQLVEICFELYGKQISGCYVKPDGNTFYCFGGFDQNSCYDIVIRSSTGSTWKTTAHYVVC